MDLFRMSFLRVWRWALTWLPSLWGRWRTWVRTWMEPWYVCRHGSCLKNLFIRGWEESFHDIWQLLYEGKKAFDSPLWHFIPGLILLLSCYLLFEYLRSQWFLSSFEFYFVKRVSVRQYIKAIKPLELCCPVRWSLVLCDYLDLKQVAALWLGRDLPGVSDGKELPAVWKTWVWSLGWEGLLEKGTATLSSILAWKSPWTEEPGLLQSVGSQRIRHDWVTDTHILAWWDVPHSSLSAPLHPHPRNNNWASTYGQKCPCGRRGVQHYLPKNLGGTLPSHALGLSPQTSVLAVDPVVPTPLLESL